MKTKYLLDDLEKALLKLEEARANPPNLDDYLHDVAAHIKQAKSRAEHIGIQLGKVQWELDNV